MYAPGILTSTNSFFYSIEKDSEGNIIKYTPLKDEIVSGTQYYLVDLV
jgi:hypothetical protein